MPQTPLDLFHVARELSLTPINNPKELPDNSSTILRIGQRVCTVLVLLSGIILLVSSRYTDGFTADLFAGFGRIFFAFGVGLALGLLLNRVSAATYRSMSIWFERFNYCFWWLAFICAHLCNICALAFASLDPEALWPGKHSAWLLPIAMSTMGIGSSMILSSLRPPLITTTLKPKHHQFKMSQITWTITLVTLVLVCGILWLGHSPSLQKSFDNALALVVSVCLALLMPIFGWHIKAVRDLQSTRAILMKQMLELSEMAESTPETRDFVFKLKEFRDTVRPDPFRSLSPAAPPIKASSTIVAIVDLLIYNSNRCNILPASITKRTSLHGEPGQVFRDLQTASYRDIRTAAGSFFNACHNRL